MADGRRWNEWDHTSHLWLILANANRDPEQRMEPFGFEDIHPFYGKWKSKRTDEDIAAEAMAAQLNKLFSMPVEVVERQLEKMVP